MITLLAIAGFVGVLGLMQWKLGFVWLVRSRIYADQEPALFAVTIGFYLLLALGLAVYATGLLLAVWTPSS